MMRGILYSVICSILVVSCKQTLCQYSYLSDDYAIGLSVDWTQSNIDPSDINNLSIYAYPEDGGSPYVRVSGSVESASISLPIGRYSLLVFNDVVGDVAGLNFSGAGSYSDFRAEYIESSATGDLYYSIGEDEVLASAHSKLSVWRVEEFVVESTMVSCPYCGLYHSEEVELDVVPTPLTTECTFRVRVENLSNAQIIQGVVRGFAAGAYLSSQERVSTAEQTELYSLTFSSRIYDDADYVDGVVVAQINTFGKAEDSSQSYELELDIILNSGELVSFSRDITDQVVAQNNIEIVISLESDDDSISLPEGSSSGFGVDSWGDKESIELW